MFENTWNNESRYHALDFEMIVMRHVDIMLPAELTPGFKRSAHEPANESVGPNAPPPDTQEPTASPAKKGKTHYTYHMKSLVLNHI